MGRCSSNKIKYISLESAMKEVNRLGWVHKKYFYAYKCPRCGYYHVTNDTEHKGKPNIKKIAKDGRIIYAKV